MPILNFQKGFADPILAGIKLHTLRFPGNARRGQLLYCQHGSRFRPTRFAVLPAMRVRSVTLTPDTIMIWDEDGRGFVVPPRDVFARADGFENWAEMTAWFDSMHLRIHGKPRDVLRGQLIQWAKAPWEKYHER